MNAKHCRRKAEEFARAAEAVQDDLRARLGWLILSNVWFSLADKFERLPLRRDSDKATAARPR